MVGFWQRIFNGKQNKIALKLYKILLYEPERLLFHSKWFLSVKHYYLISSGNHIVKNSQDYVPQNIAYSVKVKLIENLSMRRF